MDWTVCHLCTPSTTHGHHVRNAVTETYGEVDGDELETWRIWCDVMMGGISMYYQSKRYSNQWKTLMWSAQCLYMVTLFSDWQGLIFLHLTYCRGFSPFIIAVTSYGALWVYMLQLYFWIHFYRLWILLWINYLISWFSMAHFLSASGAYHKNMMTIPRGQHMDIQSQIN